MLRNNFYDEKQLYLTVSASSSSRIDSLTTYGLADCKKFMKYPNKQIIRVETCMAFNWLWRVHPVTCTVVLRAKLNEEYLKLEFICCLNQSRCTLKIHLLAKLVNKRWSTGLTFWVPVITYHSLRCSTRKLSFEDRRNEFVSKLWVSK